MNTTPMTSMRDDDGTSSMKARTGGPRRGARWAAMAVTFAALATTAGAATADRADPLLVCSRGPSDQRFHAGVTLPSRVEPGSTYTVRIDGVSSGKISHFGLNYLHDMTVDYVLPAEAYVEGSARILPGTGTANVLPGARLWYHGGLITLRLPGKVLEGTEYTPPSITVQLRAIGAPGSRAAVSLRQFNLTANAFMVGEVPVSCQPAVKPAPLATTLIDASTSASP
jgi:hypothetical protein